MKKPADIPVLIFAKNVNIARTMRTALRGIAVRTVALAADESQVLEGFATTDPGAVVIYVDGPENDAGLEILNFLRRSPASPKREIPIVIASQSRDIAAINTMINAGAHEYVLFPASGDQLLKKVTAACASRRVFVDTASYVGPCRRRRNDPNWKGPERRAAVEAQVAEVQAKEETKAS